MSWGAHRGAGSGVGEDVVLFGEYVVAFVHVLRWAGGSCAGAHAGSTVADQMESSQRAVALSTDFELHARIGTIADREVFFSPIKH